MRFPVRLSCALAALGPVSAAAEEGMWTFDNFPIAAANRDLGTNIDRTWLDRVRLASVRIGGASGGLVSPNGLIFTNEHVVSGCVEDLSTEKQNFVETGFTPGSRPGDRPAAYIDYVLPRVTVIGAIYLVLVCLLPEFLISTFHVPFYLGGTSLLIVVSVTLDTVAQIQGHLVAHQYEGLIKKSKLRGGKRGR